MKLLCKFCGQYKPYVRVISLGSKLDQNGAMMLVDCACKECDEARRGLSPAAIAHKTQSILNAQIIPDLPWPQKTMK